MATLKGRLIVLARHNGDGSYKRQHQRLNQLIRIGERLKALGYRLQDPRGLRGKHIAVIIEDWRTRGLGAGTVKNYLASLRWWAQKIGKPGLLHKNNDKLGIPRRSSTGNKDKSSEFTNAKLAGLPDERMRMATQLQREFGLRVEESLKFQPSFAIDWTKDRVRLKTSWCKGGRSREVPIETAAQREVLENAEKLAPRGSLIPDQARYIEFRKAYDSAVRRAGIKPHGLRHRYAHTLFQHHAGINCPAASGKGYSKLATDQRNAYDRAAMIVNARLGHGPKRLDITTNYLGRG